MITVKTVAPATVRSTNAGAPSRLALWRKCAGGPQALTAPPVVREVLRSPGEPLDEGTRTFMESRFQHDFSRVRVHTDALAAASARAVSAHAYTVGHDLVFAAGRYQPRTGDGRRLLAHELGHVLQQEQAPAAGLPGGEIADDPGLEAQADRMADQMAAGPVRAPEPSGAAARAGVQRQAADAAQPARRDCLQEVVGQDVPELLRTDAVTLVLLRKPDCDPCDAAEADVVDYCAEAEKPRRMRFRAFLVDAGKPENRQVVQRIEDRNGRRGRPQILVFADRKQIFFQDRYVYGGKDLRESLREVHAGAESQGVFKGMKWGSLAGGLAGGIVGGIVGGLLLGPLGILLGGLVGGAIGAAAGLGIGALIGGLASQDRGYSPLSPARLEKVRRFQEGSISEADVDKDLARDVAQQYALLHDQGFELDPPQKRTVIKALMKGGPSRLDQRAILKIMEDSSDAHLLQIFGYTVDLPLTALEPVFEGEEREALRDLLERLRKRFPVFAPLGQTKGLLLDDPAVRDVLRAAFTETHKKGSQGEFVMRECCGVLTQEYRGNNPIVSRQGKEWGCVAGGACPGPQIGLRVAKTGKRIAGSFHTHPDVLPPQAREAPSPNDFSTFVEKAPFEGAEHYVVGPLNTYLITWEGGFRVVGSTPELLGVPKTKVPSTLRSTLEIE